MPRKKTMPIMGMSEGKSCIGCEVLMQSDKTLEQNINYHRIEMADKWRLQEEVNKTLQNSYQGLSALLAGHMEKLNLRFIEHLDKMHKLERNLIYAAVVVVATLVTSIIIRR